MNDTLEKPKHKPITKMMMEFEPLYAIKLYYKPRRLQSYFLGLGKDPLVQVCKDIADAKLCSNDVANEWVNTLKELNETNGYSESMIITKVPINAN